MIAALALAASALAVPAHPQPARVTAPRRPGLAELSLDLQALADRVRPAVVQVLTTGYAIEEGLLTRERGSGSGVVLDADGYVLTNAHVVQGARRVRVVLGASLEGRSILKPAGHSIGAVVVGVDPETDLAVLKVEEKGLAFLAFGDSEELRQGQLVMAFGSPLGLEDSASLGVISAVARQLRPEDPMIYVQTDASINPGNSGGPLVDAGGRVVGINTLIYSQSGGNEGIGFAAPSNIARTVYEQIRKTGRVQRGDVGLKAQTLTPLLGAGLGLSAKRGVIVADVVPGGPAAAAGVHSGDLILSLDGKAMENARQLQVNLYPRMVGSAVTLDVLREGVRRSLLVRVQERPDDPARFAPLVTPDRNLVSRFGVLALDLDDSVARLLPPLRARAGVVIASVSGDTPAGAESLRPGDVIYALNGASILGLEALREKLGKLAPSAAVVLQIERQGELRFVAFELE